MASALVLAVREALFLTSVTVGAGIGLCEAERVWPLGFPCMSR